MQLPSIWITRPEAQAQKLAAMLAKKGIPAIVAPVMEIHASPLTHLPLKPDALVLTSQHALEALAALPPNWRDIPVYAAGSTTADAAAQLGYPSLTGWRDGALAMLQRLRETLPRESSVLYLAGDTLHVDVASLLRTDGYDVEQRTVYEAMGIEKPAAPLVAALRAQQVIALTCYSSRSAKLAARQLENAGLAEALHTLKALCLSGAISEAAQHAGFSNTAMCHEASDAAMLTLAETAIRAMA